MPEPRIAKSLGVLRDQVNIRWPGRNRASDGWIGDAAHQARESDHNPDARGIVHALDITHDPVRGCDAGVIAEAIRASGDPRIKYMIFNRRIASASRGMTWRAYSGSHPHHTHLHISVNSHNADEPRLWTIELEKDKPVPPVPGKSHYDRETFFAQIKSGPFPGFFIQEQVDGIEALLGAWEPLPYTDRRWLAYCLATALAETGTMLPRHEVRSGNQDYWIPDPTTKKVYYGRGWVQLTWKDNYEKATRHINDRDLIGRKVDLVNNPDQALEHDVAAIILFQGMAEGWFTTKNLPDYFTESTSDWVNARRIVNGLDRANEIAENAKMFLAALNASGTPLEPEQPAPIEGDEITLDPVFARLKGQIMDRTGAKQIHLICE